jgi:AhpD family alkylhydroperoxidase
VEAIMTRKQIFQDMEQKLGLVPTFFKHLPDSSLQMEWELMQRVQMEEGPIPNKYRELMGVAIAAVTKCRYCSHFHTQLARVNGATDAEIEDAVHYAKSSAGWSAYLNGLQIDFDQFKREINQAAEHLSGQVAKQR